MTSFITGIVAGLAIAVPPGAIATLILQTGLHRGFRPAFAAGLGCATVDFLYASIAVFLGAALVPVLGGAEPGLRTVAGVALIAIGVMGILGLRRRAATPMSTTRIGDASAATAASIVGRGACASSMTFRLQPPLPLR